MADSSAAVPPRFIRDGLRLFERLTRETVLALADEVPKAVSYPLDPTEAAQRLEISDEEAANALTTLTWLAVTPEPEEALEEFPESEGRSIAQAAAERLRAEPLKSSVHRAVTRAQLASRVLPSVRSIDIAVDMRVDTKGDEVVASVPVAIFAILTDLENTFTFQLAENQVRLLLSQLEETLQQIKAVEKWATR